MKAPASVLALAVAGLVLAGCGSGGTRTAAPTIAGVGVALPGRPPQPSTPAACAHRWNGATNSGGRAAAARRARGAAAALVRAADSSGYFREAAGRCLIYLVTPPRRAVVFVETARGRFSFTADAAGRFSPNAGIGSGVRVRLR